MLGHVLYVYEKYMHDDHPHKYALGDMPSLKHEIVTQC